MKGKAIKFDFPKTLCPFGYRGGPMGTGELTPVGSMTCGECGSYSGIVNKAKHGGTVTCTYDSPLHICDNIKECEDKCDDGIFERHDIPHYKHWAHCVSKMGCGGKCIPIK